MKAKFISDFLFEFEKGQDPKIAMDVGLAAKINKWIKEYNERLPSWQDPISYKLNSDGSLDINGSLSLSRDVEIPEFIKFNTIHGDFTMKFNDSLEDLDFLPKDVTGNFEFHSNSKKLTKKKFDDLGISVDGEVHLLNPRTQGERDASKRYRERGPLSSRKSIRLPDVSNPTRWGPKYTPGLKLYRMLKYMESKGDEGARYKDLIDIAWKMSYPHLERGEESRGWGVGYFSPKWRSPIGSKADKNEKGQWVINDAGKQWLKDKAHLFEDPNLA